MSSLDFLGSLNITALDQLYREFLEDETKLGEDWRRFFQGFDFAYRNAQPKAASFCGTCLETEFRVVRLIEAYRQRGHRFTRIDPVRTRKAIDATLEIENFGISKNHLESAFNAGTLVGLGKAKLKDIINHLEETYCRSIGAQFHYIRFPEQIDWLKMRMEGTKNRAVFSLEQKLELFSQLARAVLFEQFITKKFIGQKSFSLQGCEALIPALSVVMNYGSTLGLEDFQMGMAHRGRLNVLANILKKPFSSIFEDFLGTKAPRFLHQGDVKYHKGFDNAFALKSGRRVHVYLSPNPSHLEAVDPVVEGLTRARIDSTYQGDTNRIVPVLIHGDAAISGQGVVYEIVQMSELPGFSTGGTLHIVINNQIGFTTNYIDGRSSTYCTDVAKVTLSPIFHVNADDVEAVAHVLALAVEFRQKFHKDVFVDLMGYRRFGHNETDEPKYTQPHLYKAIEKHPNVIDIYTEKLENEDGPIRSRLDNIKEGILNEMEEALEKAKATGLREASLAAVPNEWRSLREPGEEDFVSSPETGFERAELDSVLDAVTFIPNDFPVYQKIRKVFDGRRSAYQEKGIVDWALAELLAFGSFLKEGVAIRFSGQDIERGTFSQRHAVIFREDSEERYVPVNRLAKGPVQLHIYNSPLSEFGVLGFEFGYSMSQPKGITLWEAQFGDFINGAQVIIDNFLCSSKTKWTRVSGIVLLLPHGFEGQGSEHSSARLERFLQLAAGYNIQVVYPSTPANYFHALRRQISRDFRLPLIVMTPKSLLRHPSCISSVGELVKGSFREVIEDDEVEYGRARKVIFCSGKVYYDLKEARKKLGVRDVALLRIEQLYPFPLRKFSEIRSRFSSKVPWVWVQEEPKNMGAYGYLRCRLTGVDFSDVSRPEADSPATGHFAEHQRELEEILNRAFE